MKSIKVCEYSRSRSFHDDLILQDQASGERSQDQWSSGFIMHSYFREHGGLVVEHRTKYGGVLGVNTARVPCVLELDIFIP